MANVIYTWPPAIDGSTVWTDWKGDFVTQDTVDNSLKAEDTFTAILNELAAVGEAEVDSRCQLGFTEALRELERYFNERVNTLGLTDDDIILDCGCDIYILYNKNNHTSWITLQNAGFNSYAISSRANISASLLAFSGTASKDNSHGVYGWNISQNIANIKTVSALNVSKNDGGSGVWADFNLPFNGSYSNASSTFYRVSSGFSYNYTHNETASEVQDHIYFRASSLALSSRDATNPNGSDTATSGLYPSGALGGLGTFDDTTDLSDISSKPTLNIFNLGFYSLWNPTAAELKSLANVVWNDPTQVSQWPQIFQSGILRYTDFITSLGIFPISSSDLTKQNVNFCMGGIVFNGGIGSLGTTLTMDQITEQIIDINLGSISLKEYFGSFLDYAPYTQISLYLPFYGCVELSANELQNADKITILYRINLYDGATVIKVHVEKLNNAAQNNSVNVKHVLYEYNTNVKTEIPITSGANSEHMKTIATLCAAAATAVAAPVAGAGASALAGGASAAASGGATMSDIIGGAAVGNAKIGAAVAGAIKTGAGAVNNAVNSLPSGGGVHRGNNGSMGFGLLSERKPWLVVNRPIQVLPQDYQIENGYTASIKTTIGTIQNGYIRCEAVDTSTLHCEEAERIKIVEILTKEGAFI